MSNQTLAKARNFIWAWGNDKEARAQVRWDTIIQPTFLNEGWTIQSGGLKNWNGSSRAHSGVSRHVTGMQARDDRHAHSTNHDSMHRQLKSWGTCGRVAFALESWHWVWVMAPSEPEGDPGSGQGKLFVELGVVTDTQYPLGLETWSKGLNLSPENIDA